MNAHQKTFLTNMNQAKARALVSKFNGDPESAYAKSGEAYAAFCICWEFLHDEYIQRANLAGGIHYNFIPID